MTNGEWAPYLSKEIPVIVCTGRSSLIDRTQAQAMGIAADMMKPIVSEELARTIRKVLGNNPTA